MNCDVEEFFVTNFCNAILLHWSGLRRDTLLHNTSIELLLSGLKNIL